MEYLVGCVWLIYIISRVYTSDFLLINLSISWTIKGILNQVIKGILNQVIKGILNQVILQHPNLKFLSLKLHLRLQIHG